ncbi:MULTISPECIES: hypothetical protein [Burkholderia]|uniref:Uncharacterized protein n=1 Tax=Burkholderia anthina TaxID=179879 RepID=A0A7T6VJ77_9BURK|nr:MULTISPECIES: hypothetical protein [Burkholderia]MBY4864983.1 hypothetical protein [Burkholderia anthina]QQK04958.1 hypothetical protein JFN94_26980 [Burkholderia anthina]
MHSNGHAVCVAINDNNRAWYEMLVPFLLSLRQTGYDGTVAVIGYGLSEHKRRILESQSVDVIEASSTHALPVGRFIEAADYCARNPRITRLALYDADIWFCAPSFDLFSQIGDDRLYACPDPLFCTFVVTPLIGERRDHHWRLVVDEVTARHGGALQAGLVAGTAAAWTRYAAHLRDCVARIGTDFQECFGIDTTFLHLWGARGETALLDPVQNFVSKNGIHESFDAHDGITTLRYQGEPIRALHMTGDIRFFDRWRYYANHVDSALRDGMPFALSDGTPSPSDTIGARIAATEYVRAAGLTVTAAALEASPGAYLQAIDEPGGTMLVGSGNHEIVFTATRDIERLNVYITHPSGSPSPLRCEVLIDGHAQRKGTELMAHFWYRIVAGAVITLRSTSLGGQQCNAIWRLREAPDMQQ